MILSLLLTLGWLAFPGCWAGKAFKEMHRKLHRFHLAEISYYSTDCIPGISYLAQVIPLICLNSQVPVGAGLPKIRAGVIPVFRNLSWASCFWMDRNYTCGPTVDIKCGTLGDVTSLSPCGHVMPGCNFPNRLLHGREGLMLNGRKQSRTAA